MVSISFLFLLLCRSRYLCVISLLIPIIWDTLQFVFVYRADKQTFHFLFKFVKYRIPFFSSLLLCFSMHEAEKAKEEEQKIKPHAKLFVVMKLYFEMLQKVENIYIFFLFFSIFFYFFWLLLVLMLCKTFSSCLKKIHPNHLMV